MKVRALIRAVGTSAVLLGAVASGTVHADGPNLLANPSFEGGMYHVSLSNFIADGWSYWYQSRATDDARGWYLPEPEYGLIANRPGQAHGGNKSQRWFNTWAIHNAGLYQRVKVPADSWLRFSIWMFDWSSESDVFGLSDSFHHKWVGIDPTGGTDPFSPEVVWGREDRTMDLWDELAVIAQARGDTVTVFVRETPEYSVKHNDVLVDDAALVTIPPPVGPVVQPLAVASRTAPADNVRPDRAAPIGRITTLGTLAPRQDATYQYFTFDYPGGDLGYTINIQASPDRAPVLANVGFRVYGPTLGKVYARSGTQAGLTPNVTANLASTEAGTYLVQLYNENPGVAVDYRIWLTGKGLTGEAALEPTAVPSPAPSALPVLPASPTGEAPAP